MRSEIADRFAPIVKCARIWRLVRSAQRLQPHLIRGPRGRPGGGHA